MSKKLLHRILNTALAAMVAAPMVFSGAGNVSAASLTDSTAAAESIAPDEEPPAEDADTENESTALSESADSADSVSAEIPEEPAASESAASSAAESRDESAAPDVSEADNASDDAAYAAESTADETGISQEEGDTAGAGKATSAQSADFAVSDSHDNPIYSFYSSKDSTYYLFLSNDMDLTNVEVSVKDAFVSANAGSYDAETGKLVIDASANPVVTLTKANGKTVKLAFRHSSLPSMYIRLNGTTLREIHASKDTKHADNSVYIKDTSSDGNDLACKKNVEIKGRGNSSWSSSDKKGYQIKFKKKQSVLGMGKAKKWTLIANSFDPTLLKNQTAYHLASQMDFSFSPQSATVDLWIDGDYRGTYSVIEKVEIGENRQDLSESGIIAELDNNFYKSEVYFTDYFDRHICLKDPDLEDTGTNWTEFQTTWNAMEKALDQGSWSGVLKYMDLDSFAKYYLVEEYLCNDESASTSRYFYRDGGKIYAGPVWDFDSCMDTYANLSPYYFGQNDPLYSRLLKFEGFSDLVNEYYKKYKSVLNSAGDYMKQQAGEIDASAAMNYVRWPLLGTTVAKSNTYLATYKANVNRTVGWLGSRAKSFTTPIPVNNVASILTGTGDPNRIKMFRLYNPNSGEHFFTAAAYEANYLKNIGWRYEGAAWYAPSSGSPVYRLYNPNAGDHHYTMSAPERDMLVSVGWRYEGVGWYSDPKKTTPLYRLYNPNAKSGTHHYTTSMGEYNYLASLGWRKEGIGWYGVK